MTADEKIAAEETSADQKASAAPRPRPRPRPTSSTSSDERKVPEQATAGDTPEAGGRRSRWWWGAAAVLAIAVAAAAVWLVHLHGRGPVRTTQPSVNSAGTYTRGSLVNGSDAAAVKAAVAYLPSVLSYDYRTLDAGLTKAKAHLTPDFATQFTNTFDDTVRPVAVKNKAVVRTLVRAAGIADRDGDTASVLVFVDQALVSGGGSTGPKISQDRVHVDLIRSKGAWLISGVTPF